MNWKAPFLVKVAAIYLAVPFTLMLVVVKSHSSNANSELQQSNDLKAQSLTLGKLKQPQSRQSAQIAPGLTHTVIVKGEKSQRDFYTVDVAFSADLSAANATAESLRSNGYQPRIQTVKNRVPDDLELSVLGYLVRAGAFATEAEAINLRGQLAAAGYLGLRVVYTGEDGEKTTGPWVVNVLEVDPARFQGKVTAALATQILPGNELLTQISSRTNAIAAVNGGYFIIGAADGTPGDLAGISIIGGFLVSEAVNRRTSLILSSSSGSDARIAAISSGQRAIASNGATRAVDGLNRKPGLIRGCGGVGGDEPTQSPKHDFTCTDSSELILFTPIFGQNAEPAAGLEVTLDESGRVTQLRQQCGGYIPKDGLVLCGTGDAAEWLQTNARTGAKIEIDTRVLADDEELPLVEGLEVVNGGPQLLRNGEIKITANAEGFNWQENPEFYYRFGVRRNPRTLAGITPEGKLLLVTVDGRQPGWSVGASFTESALIMRSLGAVDAVNLDGGGSTSMTINQQLVNRPSDTAGERAIADSIIIEP